MNNNLKMEVISEKYAMTVDPNYMDVWIESSIFLIYDGKKIGLMYNKNEWIETAPKEYISLLDCAWDHIEILNTSYGDYAVTYLKGKCRCFLLKGNIEKLQEVYNEYTFSVSFTAIPVGDNQYDSIKCEEKSSKLLIFEKEQKIQYYNIKTQEMSCKYDSIEVLNEDFIVCYQFDENKGECINFDCNICFTGIQNFVVSYKCEYADGIVFLVYDHNPENLLPQEYLLFYSKSSDRFFKTNVYEKINIFGTSFAWHSFEMSGFEGITAKRDITYRALGNSWSDNDIKKLLHSQNTN